MIGSGGSLQQQDSFTDENGNEWKWDGDDYVIKDAEGTSWIYDGEDWLAKGDNGLRWMLVDNKWYVKGLNGKKYSQNADGQLTEAPDDMANRMGGPNSGPNGAGGPNAQNSNPSAGNGLSSKHKHHHKKRHRHMSSLDQTPPNPADQIHVMAKIPPPPTSPPRPFNPPYRQVIKYDPRLAEVYRLPDPQALPPLLRCHPPPVLLGHRPSHQCCQTLHNCSPQSQQTCSHHGSDAVAVTQTPKKKPTYPCSTVCQKLKSAINSVFHGTSESETPTDVTDADGSLEKLPSKSRDTLLTPTTIQSDGSSVSLNRQKSSVVVPPGGKLVPLAQAMRIERVRRNAPTRGITGSATITPRLPGVFGDVQAKDLGPPDPVETALNALNQGDTYDRFKELAVMLVDFEKQSETSDVRQIMLNRLLEFTKSLATNIAQERSSGAPENPADDLVVILCNTLQTLIRDNLRRIGQGNACDNLWSPKEAYRVDALCSRTGQLLSESVMKLDEAEAQLKTVTREMMDMLNRPLSSDIGRTLEERQKLATCLESEFSDIFKLKKTFERLALEVSETRENAEKLSFANPKCPCRPQAGLIEDDCQFLIQRLRETSEALKHSREKLLVSEIRRMHQKNRADYLNAQLRVLISRGGGLPEESLQIVNEGAVRLEERDRDLEKRLHSLELQLDAYKKNSAPTQLEPGRTLASRLFSLGQEEADIVTKSVGDALHVARLAPLQQPPLRTLPIVQPPIIPAVELRITGDETGAVKRLADVMQQLLDVKTKVQHNGSLDSAISRVVNNIRTMIQRIDEGVETEDNTALARQLSTDITKLAFKELPEGLPVADTNLLRGIQDMAQRCHNLAGEVKNARPRGHIPFDPTFGASGKSQDE